MFTSGRMLRETERVFDEFNRDVTPDVSETVSTEQINIVNAYHRAKFKQSFRVAVGVDFSISGLNLATRSLVDARIKDNIDLITSIPVDLKGQLLDAYEDTLVKHGFDQQRLKQTLIKRFKVSDSRAKLITRDQTSKTIGALTEARQTQVGIRSYDWLTSSDERVRPSHVALNGTVQYWGIRPSVGHPGDDIQCRCVAIARIDMT